MNKTYICLVVFQTSKGSTGNYFTKLTVYDDATKEDWLEFQEGVSEYVNKSLGEEEVSVVILNIVKLNEVVDE